MTTCKNCRYLDTALRVGGGLCQVNPPVPFIDSDILEASVEWADPEVSEDRISCRHFEDSQPLVNLMYGEPVAPEYMHCKPGDTVDIMATSSMFEIQKNAIGHTGLVVRFKRSSGYPGFMVVVRDGKSAGHELWFHTDHLKLAATAGHGED